VIETSMSDPKLRMKSYTIETLSNSRSAKAAVAVESINHV
jgi:hypothetical protein